jgi:hypothetical protein
LLPNGRFLSLRWSTTRCMRNCSRYIGRYHARIWKVSRSLMRFRAVAHRL